MEWIDRKYPTLLMARRNLIRTKIRAGLAMLGIVISVVAIGALGTFGFVLQLSATESLGDIGNQVVVQPDYSEGVERVDENEVRTIRRTNTDADVVPIESERTLVESDSESEVVLTYGIKRPGKIYSAREGRIPNRLRNDVLVGADLADRMDLRPGASILVQGQSYRIAGVLELQSGFSPVDPDRAVIVPPSAINSTGYELVFVEADSGQAANQSAKNIRNQLNSREKRVTVTELKDVTNEVRDFFGVLNQILVAIGSIALIVAGISILNVMLMSTMERREEIGVMRAIGYERKRIMKILLGEASLLGVIGGTIGTIVNIQLSLLVMWFAFDDPLLAFASGNLFYLGLALTFGILTSAIGGAYPAWKAANVPPVKALRGG